ncbi:DNA topoisomerase I [Thiothrix nivea]|uniref:DNA topoisomerase 1 n=1 Tax=Thiothrix nivea (strain ATCC 35100 / DSM 5205 / JP2) TaxID=870187 RepID=A0A656HD61_THINJ|nr:DNA topoisomerase I [Thiothrix nivea]EIJ34818.1 DNA topoisomerase I [Thiothrix nivea DSM 5205]
MSENLVIVESPAKGKTIQKYLGNGFEVLASYGHVRDLIPKEGAVDPDNGYAMRYEIIDRNQRHVDAIARALKKADNLYLATDPDREGEAISWHLYELLKERGALEGKNVQRVVFHEITKRAIQDAIQHPRDLAHELVDAQQARRALDYLVGFNLSPLLWRKIKPSLSAGRVQSPALRLIVEREEEIERFVAQEYWTMTAQNEKDAQAFSARLHTLDGNKLDQFDINNEAQATAVRGRLLKASNGKLLVSKVEKKQRKRYPAPPFTTSTLQQEAVRKLRFSTQRAMRVAQQLYEGIDLGSGGPVGLITYMRTDSVTLANEAIAELRDLIGQRYGQDKVPETPNFYKTKSKNAQEAHEAVRPTSALRTPEQVKQYLNEEQFKLYELIWKRTVACQMIFATMDTVSADLSAEAGSFFRASGSTIRDPGFLLVYEEGLDDRASEKESPLPPLTEGETVTLHDINAEQHFTEPPPRYSEASLVKALEEFGIGRPSTYASIISTLLSREYVELDSRRFTPTDIGRIVNRFLTEHFTQYVDYDFTANLEDQLDAISRGEKAWVPVMDDFWQPFHKLVDEKMESVNRSDVLQSRELGIDPKSGRPVSVRLGRYGPMVQIGTRDDEEKPEFASLRPGMKLDTVTLEEALELFKLPRHLGETEDGKAISTNVGRFGPYVKFGDQFASLKKEDDPHTITLERALELIAEKKQKDLEKIIREFDNGIQILKGRWGPYLQQVVKRSKVQARLPKDCDTDKITLEECLTLLTAAAEAKSSKKAAKKADAAKADGEPADKPAKEAKPKATPKKAAAKKPAAKKTTGSKKSTS